MDPERLEAIRRNSGLALTADGIWMWGTRPVENPRVQAMFHRGVDVRPDGEVTLSVGQMWAYVACPGPAFFVQTVGRKASDGDSPTAGADPMLRLLGEREVPLFAEAHPLPVAGWGADERLYLWVHGVGGVAICLRDAHQALTERLEEGPDGLDLLFEGSGSVVGSEPGSGGTTGDRRIRVVMLAAIPSPGAPRPV